MTPIVSAQAIHDAQGALLFLAPASYKPAAGETAKALPAGYVDGLWTWDAKVRTFVEDGARLEAALVGEIKAEGERRRMLALSAGGSKKTVYSLKQAEVEAWNDLASGVLTSLASFLQLPQVMQKRRFRFASMEAARRGEPNPSAAIARFAAGSDAANTEVARIEAIEQAAIAAIKAAALPSDKRAAFAAINWSWTV